MAAISINWADLAKVAEVSLAFSVGIVVVFALGVLGLSRVEAVRDAAGPGRRPAGTRSPAPASRPAPPLPPYGIYLIVPQFH